ncbi:hypothetical protein [Halovenus halobia]|uniref:hypothetical protein n=1 Tax=Halovenus halobia TaxID=3396622 RepID=UPI003F55D3AF
MKRRTLIAGVGSVLASGTLALSSGAFSSVRADRRVTVSAAEDDDALLNLNSLGDGRGLGGNGRSIENSDGQVEFFFPGIGLQNDDDSLGLGTDSVYEFDRDSAAGAEEGLLRITNQGTQELGVWSLHETESEIGIELYDVTDPQRTALRDRPASLGVGERLDVGFRIRTFDAEISSFDETLTIVAERGGKKRELS